MEDKVTVSFRTGAKLRDALDKIAASMQRDRSFILNEAVADFITRNRAYTESIKRGLSQAKAGEFASDEEVDRVFALWE